MSPNQPAPCSHELGPGITVCLRCRHDALVASRARAARALGLFAMGAVGVTIAGALAVAGFRALNGRRSDVAVRTMGVTEQSLATVAPATPRRKGGADAPAGVREAEAAPAPSTPMAPVLPAGRSDLGNGVYAVRDGGTVTVHFDTPLGRTRRPEKFEATVRATLPLVYGATATRILAEVPRGELAASGDLLTVLPERGVHVPVSDGWNLALWPETRPGVDGPLVVSYRTQLTR